MQPEAVLAALAPCIPTFVLLHFLLLQQVQNSRDNLSISITSGCLACSIYTSQANVDLGVQGNGGYFCSELLPSQGRKDWRHARGAASHQGLAPTPSRLGHSSKHQPQHHGRESPEVDTYCRTPPSPWHDTEGHGRETNTRRRLSNPCSLQVSKATALSSLSLGLAMVQAAGCPVYPQCHDKGLYQIVAASPVFSYLQYPDSQRADCIWCRIKPALSSCPIAII